MSKKEKDLNRITSVNTTDLVRMITANGESVNILINRFLGQIFMTGSLVGYDINNLYLECNTGLSLHSFSSDQANPNTPDSNGMCIHCQRQGKGNVSSSQMILDIFFKEKIYIRTGKGNGKTVIYTEWRQI